MKLSRLRTALAVFAVLGVAACGGGGGDSFRAPPATLSQDIEPAGARLDLRSRNYFPLATGDTWTYDLTQNGTTLSNSVTRTVVSGPDVNGDSVLNEVAPGGSDSVRYRRTAQGLLVIDPLAGVAPPAVRQFVGDILEIPEPFYPAGSALETIRQGSWGEDIDGDGHPDGYRLEYRRSLVGFENVTLPNGSAEAVHLRSVTVFQIFPSSPDLSATNTIATEDSWWAPAIGLVRAERRIDGDGAQPMLTLVITGGNVGGQVLFAQAPGGGNTTKVTLTHNDLVFDRTRQVYYASVPGSVTGVGNSIATITPQTGAVVYSAPIGSEPFALGLAPDGSALYVGLNGSGELVKLLLPSMQEAGRVRLPTSTFYGQLLAESIAVSPTSPDVVAVSTLRTSVSPRHGGVVLVRNLVVQPVATQEHTGSNLIAFDSGGQVVYGFNNETTEFGLRRIAVQADGLVEVQVVTAANGNFGTRVLELAPPGVILGNTVYRPADLAPLGQVSAPGGGCRWIETVNRLACFESGFGTSGAQRLVVADGTTFVTLATPEFATAAPQALPTQIVPGPLGEVALRLGNTYWNSPASEVWLFRSAALQ